MPVLDFYSGRRTVWLDGRRFVIRRVTVAALIRGLELFAAEVNAVRSIAASVPALFSDHGETPGLFFFPCQDGRMLSLLRMVVESDVPDSEWPVERLAEEVAGLTDWKRIAKSLKWTDEDPTAADGESEWVIDLARAVGTSPVELVEWPCEALTAIDDAAKANGPKSVDPDALAAMLGGSANV